MINRSVIAALLAFWAPLSSFAADAGVAEFRSLYKELVEIETTLSAGNCSDAARAMQARLRAAGYSDQEVSLVVPPGMPKQGNLVAVLRGTDPKAKAILLLAHIDVVEAKREDWKRDPFKLTEENGVFYARGAADDKSMAAIFTDSLIRYRKSGFKPRRDIKLALTCGEETPANFNGVKYLLEHHRALIDAAFALNEGATGRMDKDGKRLALDIQAGEKTPQAFRLEATGPGGHASRPTTGNNPIYHVAAALTRIEAHEFPVELNDVTRQYFERLAATEAAATSADLRAVAASGDAQAAARIARDPQRNGMMRTTCVATQFEGGHAPNALPQRAAATINCRILPGTSPDSIRSRLTEVVADAAVEVKFVGEAGLTMPAPILNDRILEPATRVAAKMWPGVPLVPAMSTGATDGRFLNAAGIPTYGLSGIFVGPEGAGAHGVDEHIAVRSLLEGRDFLYELVKLYAMQTGAD
jgi:acetylornithine deacetylase/succinyl-diaminopimelate desuccinylase-like protein